MNKIKSLKAVALEYDETSDKAPRVTLNSSIMPPQELIRLARRFGVPIINQPELALALDRVGFDTFIPQALYKAVAIILARLRS